ncbi:response regulator [Teredinibacter turnerae]|uniref:Alkaline phosphatase synthesis transcriptional regulatory protein PhoP n=1 Tax=Teredinibacter turnerae (strain ATCC 39867 / T7901) TaxID=377629 RepID=C5BIX9_TERTT|nr:response regulator [Teredinibacter turnerae]ACR13326.1 alkaline phosphatase synthesis transcriptional regulatory protein PhoP [Teredinibacter turnerae T7901]
MSKNVLVVDDSSSVRQVVGLVLKNAGFDVVEACNGEEALKLLDGRKLHLIVSDLNMPVMDGITFAKHAKEMDDYKFTPILMLTTESDQEKKKQGKEAGIKAWLVKPFQPPLLLSAVSKLT